MEILQEYWPFLLPLILAQLVLLITALMHVLKHQNYRFGSRTLWIIVVVFFQILGPVAYFVFGRGEDG